MKNANQRQLIKLYRRVLEVFNPSHKKFPEKLVFKIHDWAEAHEEIELVNTEPDYLERIWHALRNGGMPDFIFSFLRTLAALITNLEKNESRCMRNTFRYTFGIPAELFKTKFAI